MAKPLQKALTRKEFLRIIGARLEGDELKPKDFAAVAKLYAEVARFKVWKIRKSKPTINDVVLQLEQESKNGRTHRGPG